ncbi:MAG: signal peptidase II, partial [Oscillospiraceae bacterium]|nr:signal peptidase II [Oscillospiraceae bacterium]
AIGAAAFATVALIMSFIGSFPSPDFTDSMTWVMVIGGMIIGGALANGIERVYHNYVTDFFKFAFINFPVFNVADSFITVGGILLCLILFFDKEIEL